MFLCMLLNIPYIGKCLKNCRSYLDLYFMSHITFLYNELFLRKLVKFDSVFMYGSDFLD